MTQLWIDITHYFTLNLLYTLLWVIYACSIIGVIGVILSENRSPVKSLAWVTVLLLLPAVGLVLYVFFGRNIRNTSRMSRRLKRRLRRRQNVRRFDPSELSCSPANVRNIRLAHSLTGAHLHAGNDARIFTDGKSKFDALLADIAAAESYIHLQYYIFNDDDIGRRVADALIERAKAGVKVRVIYDHVGSYSVKSRFFGRMRRAGIEAYPFFKVTFPPFGTRINWRNHRKLVVIDGAVGYIGGMNIADRYITGGKFDRWVDMHLRVTGPVVTALDSSFLLDWAFMGKKLPPQADDTPDNKSITLPPRGNMEMQLLTSGPIEQWPNISLLFHKAIAGAMRRVYIVTPYFLPNESLLRALETVALAKVDVRVIMPRRSDSDMLRWASNSYISECLKAGIKIYFYNPGMLHAKAIIVDDEFATVGSTNFDFRSFEHNFESNMFVYSREFNAAVATHIEALMRESTRVTPRQWDSRPRRDKMLESVMRLFAPIL